MTVIDLFAGPGGWSQACQQLGIAELGIEWDADACQTRRNAGHATIHGDVSQLDPNQFVDTAALIASPPCPAFSAAGNQEGVNNIHGLCHAIRRRDWAYRPSDDPEVWLALEVGRWFDILAPDWVCLEQVPAAMPLWEAYAALFDGYGYSTWCDVLNAADYGVPQTRKRAILIASRRKTVDRPPTTHAERPQPTLFGDELASWVTMADALGWSSGRSLIVNTRRDQRPDGTTQTFDAALEPAKTLTTMGYQWVLPDNLRLTIGDILTLQAFSSDYPVHGSKTSQFKQIGNAIPPLLAHHILKEATT